MTRRTLGQILKVVLYSALILGGVPLGVAWLIWEPQYLLERLPDDIQSVTFTARAASTRNEAFTVDNVSAFLGKLNTLRGERTWSVIPVENLWCGTLIEFSARDNASVEPMLITKGHLHTESEWLLKSGWMYRVLDLQTVDSLRRQLPANAAFPLPCKESPD